MNSTVIRIIFLSLLIILNASASDDCPGIYYPYSSHIVNSKPISIFAGDLDNDGDQDIAVACYWREFMSVILNNGNMTFTWPVWEHVRIYTEWIDGADLDNDGDIDIVVANSQNNSVSVLLNNGDATFAMRSDYTTYGGARSVCAALLNDDEYVDLVAANYWTGRISVLMNDGDGTFAGHQDYAFGGNPRGVFAADLDNDEDNDIITANMEQNNITVFINDGYGVFDIGPDRPVGGQPFMVYAADLNNDDHLDLVTANSGDNSVSILLNTGYGASFAPQITYPAGAEPVYVRPVDIDGDGDCDLTTANNGDHTLTTLINNGDGEFNHIVTTAVDYNPYGIADADFNSDGHVDIAIAQFQSNYVSILRNKNALPFTGSIAGTVQNHLGEPVADAKIKISQTSDSCLSDSGGAFFFDSLCCTSYSLQSFHQDFCDTIIGDIWLGPDDTALINITVNFRAIGGIITDSTTNPIESVLVEISDEGMQNYTDANGEFYFGCVDSGAYSLSFYHPHYTDTSIAGVQPSLNDTASIELVMQARGFLEGIITDEQLQPAEGIEVLSLVDGIADTSGSDGAYSLIYLNARNHDIYFNSPYYYDTTITGVNISPGDTSYLNLSLKRRPDLEIWYGSLNCEPVMVRIDDDVAVDMYIRTAGPIQIENARFILGANDQYIDSLLSVSSGEILYPFNNMEQAAFSSPVGSPPNQAGWSSQYLEVSATMAQSPWFDFSVPTVAARFVISTIEDTSIVGDTAICIGSGVDDTGDSSYAEGFGTIEYSVLQHFCPFTFTSGYRYLPGDVNMYNGSWPPEVIGGDVTYLVNYLRGLSQSCPLDGFWAAADINGDCLIIGSDVTRLVSYFRGNSEIFFCPDYPPQWQSILDIPPLEPLGWPGCDE